MILVKLSLVINCTMMQLPRLTKNQTTKPLIEADRTTNMRMGHAKRIAFSRSVPVSVFFRRTATPGESSSFIKGIPVQYSFSFLSFTGIRMLFPATTSENFALGSGEGTLSVLPFFNLWSPLATNAIRTAPQQWPKFRVKSLSSQEHRSKFHFRKKWAAF